jgi:CTP synthase
MISEILSLKSPLSSERKRQGEVSRKAWNLFVKRVHTATDEVRIAIVGKYFDTGDFVLSDAYLSVIEALKHAAFSLNKKPVITWINSGDFEVSKSNTKQNVVKNLEALGSYDGILVPGGFGSRGITGKLAAIRFAREHKIPYLGLCYGMQLAVIEFASNVAGVRGATSREIDDKAKHQVITIMESQKEKVEGSKYGGSMRLGSYDAHLLKGSIVASLYGKAVVSERHRHRYEVNNEYVPLLEEHGIIFSGTSPQGDLMEFVELSRSVHPFFVGTQAHPEFKSHPTRPHPLFVGFISASIKN